MKQKFSVSLTLALVLAMLVSSLAVADGINADADALVLETPHTNEVAATQSGGTTVSYPFSAVIEETGNATNDVFPGSVSVSITMAGAWLGGGTSGPWTFTAFDAPQAGTIEITVPCGSQGTTETMTVDLQAGTSSNGKSLNPSSRYLSYQITAGPDDASCTPSNTAPTVDAGGPYSGAEGSAISLDSTVSDPDSDPLTTSWTYSIVSADPGAACSFGDASAVDTTISCNDDGTYTATLTADDGHGHIVSDDATVTVSNENPVVAAPSWANASVACRTPATLTGISFSDAGVIDYPWVLDIDWGDGSSHYNDNNVLFQSAQGNQNHTYNTPGTYYATVGVTDKDGGLGSNTSGNLNVYQTYTINFLQPFDGSTPSNLITNTMKSGRTVPVKVTIYDDCAQAFVTDPETLVRIGVTTVAPSGGSTDVVEVYADAGASNGNTAYFRWTSDTAAPGGGFWIYNLDSKTALNGSALLINTTYRVDVFVGSVKATSTKWALLKPVK